ncbi:hypothetical protein [Pseudomonas sp. NPDC007930]|uniref:hypothetical protein n=1 Tax=Pseudomonas sp. NPDC007930 TaxID=3364417 RepID=UPI0036EECE10
MKAVLAWLLVVSVLFQAGCGTYTGRLDPEQYSRQVTYYKGVQAGLGMIGLNRSFQVRGGMDACGWVILFCAPVVLAILPADFAIDTLLLPVDFLNADKKRDITYAQAKAAAAEGYVDVDFNNAVANAPLAGQNLKYSLSYWRGEQQLTVEVPEVPLDQGRARLYVPGIRGYEFGSLDFKLEREGSAEIRTGAGNTGKDQSASRDRDIALPTGTPVVFPLRVTARGVSDYWLITSYLRKQPLHMPR